MALLGKAAVGAYTSRSAVAEQVLELQRRHADETPENSCEVGLAPESNFKRDVHDLRATLAQKFLRTIDALVQYELMRRQIGAVLEQLRKVRRAHLGQTRQLTDLEGLIKIFPDFLNNARQATGRDAE